jgi:hypothetical protein
LLTRKEAEYGKGMMSNDDSSQVNVSGPQRAQFAISALSNENDIEAPDNDWSHQSPNFGTATIYAVVICFFFF